MSETLARYNVILELLTESSGAKETQKEVAGLQKEFKAAQNNFAKIVSKDVVLEAIGGVEKMRKALGEIAKVPAVDKLLNEIEQLAGKTDLTVDEFNRLEKASFELGQELGKSLPEGVDNLDKLAKRSQVLTGEFSSAKEELKLLMTAINSGLLDGDELEKARRRAAALTDEIGDVREQIKNMSSDTRGLDTIIEGTRLMAAGFGIAEGAAALFGDENEEIQKALVKLNAIMVIQNGLQEVHALLMQNSNIKMKIATTYQAAYTAVVGTSTGALKAFRLAMAATGIGLAVIAIGALIANWSKVKEVLFGVNKAQDALNQTMGDYKSAAVEATQQVEKVRISFELAKEGTISKEKALKDYNDTFGDTLGVAKDFNEAEAIMIEKADAYIKAQGLKAQANALLALSAQETAKSLTASSEDNRSTLAKIGASLAKGLGSYALEAAILGKSQVDNTNKIINSANNAAALFRDEAKKLEKQAEVTLAEAGIVDQGLEEKKKKDREDALKKRQALEIEAAEARAVARKKEAEKTIEDERDLARAIVLINLQKDIEILKINKKYADASSAEFKRLGREIEAKQREIDAVGRTLNELTKLGIVESEANRQLENTLTILKSLEEFAKSGKLSKAFGNDVGKMIKFFQDIPGALAENKDKVLSEVSKMMDNTIKYIKAKEEAEAKDIDRPFLAKLFGLSDENYQKFIVEPLNNALADLDTAFQKEAEIAQKKVDIQQSRVDKAAKIAEKGNVRQLEIEEERLAKLQEQQETAVKRQQALQEAQVFASQAVAAAKSIEAVTQAAAIPFPGNIPALAFTVLALGANIAAITSTIKGSFADIPNFILGSELIGADPRYAKNKVHNGVDGYVFRGDGKERVVDGDTNSKLNGFPNALLPDAVKLYTMQPKVGNYPAGSGTYALNDLKAEMALLRESFENSKTEIKLDQHGFAIRMDRMHQQKIRRQRYTA